MLRADNDCRDENYRDDFPVTPRKHVRDWTLSLLGKGKEQRVMGSVSRFCYRSK